MVIMLSSPVHLVWVFTAFFLRTNDALAYNCPIHRPCSIRAKSSPSTINIYHNYFLSNLAWRIRAVDGVVNITLKKSSALPYPKVCLPTSLKIYDGQNYDSLLLAKLNICRLDKPFISYISSTNEVLITFESMDYINNWAFQLKYQRLQEPSAACQAVPLVLTAGDYQKTIKSSNNPDSYPAKKECTWRIRTRYKNKRIKIKILKYYSEDCVNGFYDYLKIYDGPSAHDESMVTLCGKLQQDELREYVSSSEAVFLKFHSGGFSIENGFILTYEQVDARESDKKERRSYYATKEKQWMQYPSHNNGYVQTSENASWIIYSAVNGHIKVDITEFNPVNPNDCLDIYDGPNEMSIALRHICSSTDMNQQVNSTSNVLSLRFSKRRDLSKRFFKLSYSRVGGTPHVCADLKTLDAATSYKELTSPNYPDVYRSNSLCRWLITSEWDRVQIRVAYLDLEYNSQCRYDSITFYDGPTSLEPRLRKICTRNNTTEHPLIISTSKDMLIKFSSDESNEYNGFRLVYNALKKGSLPIPGCDGLKRLFATTSYQELTSPNYPDMYSSNLNCKWLITSEQDLVQIQVVDLDIENGFDCSFDSLKFADGDSSSSPQLGRLCTEKNGTAYAPIISTSKHVYIRFTSDKDKQRHGFKLRYKALDVEPRDVCKRLAKLEATLFDKELKSPNFPKPYPSNSDCRWLITSEWNVIQVRVAYLDLEYNDECSYDSLTFYNGFTPYGPELSRICTGINGTDHPNIISPSNHMLIRFTSDASDEYKGFVLLYKALSANIFDSSGDSDLYHNEDSKDSKLNIAAIVGGVVAAAIFVFLFIGITYALIRSRRRKRMMEQRSNASRMSVGINCRDQTATTVFTVSSIDPTAPPPSYEGLNPAYMHTEDPPSYETIAHLYQSTLPPSHQEPSSSAGQFAYDNNQPPVSQETRAKSQTSTSNDNGDDVNDYHPSESNAYEDLEDVSVSIIQPTYAGQTPEYQEPNRSPYELASPLPRYL